MEKRIERALSSVREKVKFQPELALVLGSGLGALADEMEQMAILPYEEIEGFPASTVAGHKGRFVFGYIENVPVVVMQGRVHYYEGYSMPEVVLPTRLMGKLGAKRLFLTNAAGGIHPSFHAGDLMLITDQISSFVPSPLIGKNLEAWGPRFPDMSEIYSHDLRERIRETAKTLGLSLQEGIYLQTSGPAYESPAEIRMFAALGASAVGMSTACEALAARHMGMEVCGISCISNMAAGLSTSALNHQEVQETADRVAGDFKRLVRASIAAMKS